MMNQNAKFAGVARARDHVGRYEGPVHANPNFGYAPWAEGRGRDGNLEALPTDLAGNEGL